MNDYTKEICKITFSVWEPYSIIFIYDYNIEAVEAKSRMNLKKFRGVKLEINIL